MFVGYVGVVVWVRDESGNWGGEESWGEDCVGRLRYWYYYEVFWRVDVYEWCIIVFCLVDV